MRLPFMNDGPEWRHWRVVAGALLLWLMSAAALAAAPAPQSASPADQQQRIERLSANVRNATAVRAVRRLQVALNHYREAGLWREAAQLFTRDATAQYGAQSLAGRGEIAAFLQSQVLAGTGRRQLGEGDLNTHLAFSPVITVDADGRIVRGRWHELSMTGRYGANADWANGIYENVYAEENGIWKIRHLHYYPSFVGPYAPGWRNADRGDSVTIAPFHYTPAGAGTPIPLDPVISPADRAPADAAGRKRRVAQLAAQLACLQAESKIRSLQSAYGFYMDRRMWDDIADLYADDGTFEPGQRGVYRGRASIRHALEQIGPKDLAVGVINDHIQLQPVVTLAPDCHSATLRGTEFVMAGQNGGDAAWGINFHDDTYRFIDGRWRLQSAHVYQRMRSDYTQGWAKSAFPVRTAAAGYEPDAPPTVKYAAYPVFYVPPLRFPNPGRDRRPFGNPSVAASAGSLDELLAAAERDLDIVNAQDGAENVSNAYGYYIDESLWDNTAELFAVNGSKELAGVGNYIGREHVRESMVGRYGRGGRRAGSMTLHQKTEPVVTVADDGRTARIREKLLQLNSSRDGDGSYIIGIYENNIVRENGVWKISRMDLDYTWNASYSTGWARVTPRRAAAAPAGASATPAAPAAPARANNVPPPDGPLRGAPAAPYPDLATMAFHYRNPVSGRDPPELLPP